MSLKEYLIKKDQKNFRLANGLEENNDLAESKKRKYGEISKEDDEGEEQKGTKKVLTGKGGNSFLDVGSVSWSILLACFFLSLHDDRKNFFISLDSVKEMLSVLKQEFKDFVPFETDPKLLESHATDDLVKLKDNQFIECINASLSKDSSEWRFLMTDKGKKRAKSLCRNVGILVSVEIDIENPTTNKITINLYDKDVMPLVDELYQVESSRLKGEDIIDHTQQALPNSGGGGTIFEEFIGTIENEID